MLNSFVVEGGSETLASLPLLESRVYHGTIESAVSTMREISSCIRMVSEGGVS